jgi:hypothetical protein
MSKEHPVVIDSLQYDLERAYHIYRQHAAAQQRFVAEAERHAAAASTAAPQIDSVVSRLRSAFVRGANGLTQPRRQVAGQGS